MGRQFEAYFLYITDKFNPTSSSTYSNEHQRTLPTADHMTNKQVTHVTVWPWWFEYVEN